MSAFRSRLVRCSVIASVLLMSFATLAPTPAAAAPPSLDLRNAMRKLWEDHITWTRLYIVNAAADLPEKDAAAQRLLQNQTDIGNAIKPYYGEDAGNMLTALLREHILGAVDLIAAAKDNDRAKMEAASERWYVNGENVAMFLSAANPAAWPPDAMKAEMKMHLDLTLQEASDHLSGKFAEDVADYDQIHEHILKLADALSDGIINQFPDRFD